jgi:hypothetical protein
MFGALAIALLMVTAAFAKKKGNSSDDDSAESNNVPDPAAFTPNKDPIFHITPASTEPKIDGMLDDDLWSRAVKVENFTEIQPGDNIQPEVTTEAYFAYDENNLYVAFVCYENTTNDIRATITDRDAMFSDDYVGIMIDTFNDQQNAYEFFVNPHGVQGDLRRTGNHEDSSYDAVWYSGGKINGNSWTAEISIPFRSIRFPDMESQSWGMHIIRNRPRSSREQHSWVPISRDENCLFCEAGTLNGLDGINQGKNVEVLPYVIGSQYGGLEDTEDPNSQFINENGAGDAGVGLKYGITPNYTLDFTYNPDFSQIESDAAQISANQTFALFYRERRPFFQEGADIFDTEINTVYTRTINDPILASKITGKSGRTTVGYMVARDENSPYIVPFEESSQMAINGKSYSNIVRVKRDFLEDSHYGLIATDRRNETNGGANTNIGIDSRIRFREKYRIEAQIQGSYTREPDDSTLSEDFDYIEFGDQKQYNSLFDGEEFAGYAAEIQFGRSARHWNFWTWYNDYSPTFRAENGFVRSNNFRETGLWTGFMVYFDENRYLERMQPQFNFGRKYNHDGLFKDEWIQPNIWVRFRKQTSLWAGYLISRERFNDVYVDGIRRIQGNIHSNFSQMLSGGFYVGYGHSLVRDENPRLGEQMSTSVWATLKPTAQLKMSLDFNSFSMYELNDNYDRETNELLANAGDEIYDVYVVRAKLTYQFTRNLFFRVVTQYVDSDDLIEFDPLLSYKLNPFTVFFLGSSHDFMQMDTGIPGDEPAYTQTERTYFVKFQYLFRL